MFTDLSPLAELDLEALTLEDVQVADVSPLADMTTLFHIELGSTQVADIAPLAGLVNLAYLDLSDTPVSDVSPLAELKNLKQLDLSDTQITDEQVKQLQQALPNCKIVR